MWLRLAAKCLLVRATLPKRESSIFPFVQNYTERNDKLNNCVPFVMINCLDNVYWNESGYEFVAIFKRTGWVLCIVIASDTLNWVDDIGDADLHFVY